MPIRNVMHTVPQRVIDESRAFFQARGYDCLHRPTSKTMPSVTVQANGSLQATRPQMRSAAAISHVALCITSNQGSSGSPAAVVLTSAVRDSIYSARGNATAFQPDPFGAPLKIEQPLNRVTTITRDSASRLTSSVSPSGHTVSYSYTGIDLTSTYDNTTGRYITMTYDPTYHQLVTWTGDVDSFHNFWNGAGELDSSRVNTDPATRYSSYDAFGRPTTITDPAGHTISYTYGPSGTLRNTTIVTAAARTLTRIYDYYGRDSVTIASDNGRNTTLYDYIGRDTLHVGPIADTTITRYDALYITSIRDPLGDWHNFSTNSLGWHDSETDPTGHAESFRYDSTGNVVGYFNRRGQYIALAYDALDQVQSRTADGQTTTFALDPNLRFSVVRAAASYDSIAFDVAGRPVTEVSRHAGQTDSLSSSFDSHNLRQTLSISSPWNASIAYHYNAKLQLDTLTDVANGKAAIGVNADGLPTSLTLPNGLGITSDFPATHTPSSYIYNNPTINTQLGEDLAYSTRSQLSKRVWTGQSNSTTEVGREYSYDLRSRLSQYNRYTITGIENGCDGHRIDDNGNSCVYAGDTSRTAINTLFYDGNGNRSDSGAVRLTGNRLARFAGDTMLYDLDGNLVKRWTLAGGRTDSLIWNSLGQLVTFIHNGAATNFTYDGFGRRIQKASSSGTSNYIWDGDELFAELDGSGARVAEYTYFPGIDNPMSVRRWSGGAATMYYYLLDYPGNVIGLLDGSQQLIKSYTYRPSGVVEDSTSTSSVINTLKFDAREFDSETGLYYTRARYYDPSLGRFISEDPAGLVAGLNPYLYASNDPVNLADPDGLDGCGKALEEEGYTTVNLGTHDWCIPPATLPPVIVTPQSPFDPPQAPVPIPYSPFNPTPGPGGPAPAPASPTPPAPKTAKQFLACTASGTAQNFQDFNSAVGRGGRWLIKSAIGAGIAKGLGVPRVGGVLYRGLGVMGDVAPEAYWGELTVSLSATVESWGITYAGADALAAGLVGSAGTGLLAAGAYFGAVGLGSLAVALWRCS